MPYTFGVVLLWPLALYFIAASAILATSFAAVGLHFVAGGDEGDQSRRAPLLPLPLE
ncbi:MAG: hypothetical protein LBI69_00760 [Puniceicoccales bacterium]|nr:hypothetical protein [Puniceicoccales bacterium]